VLVDGVIEELKEKYPDGSVSEYLEKCGTTFWTIWIPSRNVKGSPKSLRYSRGRSDESAWPERDPFRVIRGERDSCDGDDPRCPYFLKTTPTYVNLFGTIQRLTIRAAAGRAILWICAAARFCAPTADF